MDPGRPRHRPTARCGLRWLLPLWLLFGQPAAGLAAETILGYHSDIRVQGDAWVTVEETIRVRAEGRAIRRGIYRDIPTDYRDRLGNRYRVRLEVLGVQRDGRGEPFHTERRGNGLRIYAGDRDVLLAPGEYTYRIRYRSNRQLGFFADHDELYWNVTGNGWDFPIAAAEARVRLPAGVPATRVSAEAYTGVQGARGGDYSVRLDSTGETHFRTTRPLQAGEGLTIVVSWPKGFVDPPTSAQRAGDFLDDNREALVGGGGLLLLLLYYLVAWFKVGRDPPPGVVVPRYQPPSAYSPAALRYVRRMGYDDKTFATAVVNLAVQGRLRITEEADGQFALEAADGSAGAPAAGESALERALFGAGRTRARVELQQANHRVVAAAREAHRRALRLGLEKSHFLTNAAYTVPAALFSIGVVAVTVLALPDDGRRQLAAFMSFWLAGWSIGALFVGRAAVNAWRAPGNLGRAVAATLFAAPFLAGEAFGIGVLATQGSVALVLVLLGVLALNLGFYHWLRAPTLRGRRLLDQVAGFREYLTLAEQDELAFKHPPERTPALFERYLPYALALDVEQAWAARFTGILAAARMDRTYQPAWYQGSHFRQGDISGLSRAVGSGMGSAIAAAATAPGSTSGGGGGGSSGGGGGGGGGGGW